VRSAPAAGANTPTIVGEAVRPLPSAAAGPLLCAVRGAWPGAAQRATVYSRGAPRSRMMPNGCPGSPAIVSLRS
jgi:hypothetical protein